MKTIAQILILFLQLIFACLFGIAPAALFNAGGTSELVFFILGFTLGVWLLGTLTGRVAGTFKPSRALLCLAGTLLLAAAGAGLILVTPSLGTIRIFYPLAGAFLGYYLVPRLFRRMKPGLTLP